MAITRSGAAHGTDTSPPGSVTPNWAINGNGTAGSDVIVVALFIGSSVTGATVSDNVNTGNYTKIAQWAESGGNTMAVFVKLQQKNALANTLTISVANTGAPQGQLYVCSFTGFAGLLTFDSQLGEVDATVASGTPGSGLSNTVFGSSTTNFANTVAIVVDDGDGTQITGTPPTDGQGHNWSDFSGATIAYSLIIPTAGSPAAFVYKTQAVPTGSTFFQLAAVYDFPGTGDDLLSDGRDLLAYDNRWTYCAPATTDWIHVGTTGAFCNLNSGANPAFAFFSGSFTADQQAQCQFVSSVTNAFAGLAVRLSAGAGGPTGYFAWFDAAHYNIGVVNNGVLTSLIGGPQLRTTNVGDIFNLTVSGSTLTLSVNGTTLRTVTNTTVTSGNPGIAFNGTHPSTVIDIFRGGSLGTSLSGQTSNSIIGQISEIVSYKPTAQTGSFTVGTPTDALTLSLAGQTASFAEGALVFVENITAQTATFTEGVITASTGGNVTVNFGAQSFQMAQGQLFDFISYVLDQGANVAQLFSQTATFAQGNIIAEADYFPLAFTVTSAEGVATSALADSLGSLTFASSEGLITATAGSNFNKTFSAQSLTSSEGVIAPEADYFPLAQTVTFTEGTITFSSTGDFSVTLAGTFGAFANGSMVPTIVSVIPITPGTYPNLAGLILDEATQQLEIAGAIVPASIGYFGTWPITVTWTPSLTAAPFVVIAQSRMPGSLIVPNQPITLTVSEPDKSVAYP